MKKNACILLGLLVLAFMVLFRFPHKISQASIEEYYKTYILKGVSYKNFKGVDLSIGHEPVLAARLSVDDDVKYEMLSAAGNQLLNSQERMYYSSRLMQANILIDDAYPVISNLIYRRFVDSGTIITVDRGDDIVILFISN